MADDLGRFIHEAHVKSEPDFTNVTNSQPDRSPLLVTLRRDPFPVFIASNGLAEALKLPAIELHRFISRNGDRDVAALASRCSIGCRAPAADGGNDWPWTGVGVLPDVARPYQCGLDAVPRIASRTGPSIAAGCRLCLLLAWAACARAVGTIGAAMIKQL